MHLKKRKKNNSLEITFSREGQNLNWTLSSSGECGLIAGKITCSVTSRDFCLPVVIVAVDLGRHFHHSHQGHGEVVLRWNGKSGHFDLLRGNIHAHLRHKDAWGGDNWRYSQLLR